MYTSPMRGKINIFIFLWSYEITKSFGPKEKKRENEGNYRMRNVYKAKIWLHLLFVSL